MTEAAPTAPRFASLSSEQIAERRRAMDSDVWLFIKWVCGHGAEDLERFHRPLAYLMAGDAIRLAACLNRYESEIVSQIRAILVAKGIDWNSAIGLRKLKRCIARVNDRISRSMGKTTIGLDVLLWLASRDPSVDDVLPEDMRIMSGPDMNIGIASKSDAAAWAMCEAIGNTMRLPEYKLYYSDRFFPSDTDSYITMKYIQMNGRTKTEQHTIEARGVTAQWYSKHHHLIYGDDLSSTEAKQGEATIEDAIRYIASLHGLSIAERWGGTRFLFNGTIQGPEDDHAKLMSNEDFLTIIIPIWKRVTPASFENAIREDGVPILPELYDVDAIRQKRADTISTGRLGLISWLQNFEMVAASTSSMKFTMEMLRQAEFVWVTRTVLIGTTPVEKREIRRYLWNPDKSPKTWTAEMPKVRECLCWQRCGLPNHAYYQFDPLTKPRMMGVDQAVVDKTGDQWGVGCSTIDPYGVMYQLRGEYETGYWKMIPAIEIVFNRWGGAQNPVQKVGCEAISWQGLSVDWMKRGSFFPQLANRLEKLPYSETAKVMRIMRDIYANLQMGTLLIDPTDSVFKDCAMKYNAAEPDRQWDDPLDCVAMSVQMHTWRASALTEKDLEKLATEQEARRSEDCDPYTGVDVSSNWLEYATWN